MKNYLIHYGTPGQKHGLRNYQNEDGTWTELGKLRRRQAEAALKPGKDGKPSRLEKITSSTGDIVENVKKLSNRKQPNNYYKNAGKLTDSELRDKINRMNLEKQYSDLMNQKDSISKGQSKVNEILDIAAPIVAIGASAATIATAIYNIKKGA